METYHTYKEIKSQTQAWAQALEVTSAAAWPDPQKYDQVIFTGCGSTYYLSLSGAALYQELTGQIARAIPGGELLLNSQTVLTSQRTLLVAVSRSGTTTETVKAVEKFRSFGGCEHRDPKGAGKICCTDTIVCLDVRRRVRFLRAHGGT